MRVVHVHQHHVHVLLRHRRRDLPRHLRRAPRDRGSHGAPARRRRVGRDDRLCAGDEGLHLGELALRPRCRCRCTGRGDDPARRAGPGAREPAGCMVGATHGPAGPGQCPRNGNFDVRRHAALGARPGLYRHGRLDPGAGQDRGRGGLHRQPLRRVRRHPGRLLPRRDGRQDAGRDRDAGRAVPAMGGGGRRHHAGHDAGQRAGGAAR